MDRLANNVDGSSGYENREAERGRLCGPFHLVVFVHLVEGLVNKLLLLEAHSLDTMR